MITNYTLAMGISITDLEEEVCAAIDTGWQPLGGVAVAFEKDEVSGDSLEHYTQALVMYGSKERVRG